MVPTIRGSQGIEKSHGAKVNKDAEKSFELLSADCVHQFKFFLLHSLANYLYLHC